MSVQRSVWKGAALAACLCVGPWGASSLRGQADAWVTGNTWTRMDVGSAQPALSLPTPGGTNTYNGMAAKYSQHVRTNGSGQLIFFEVDGFLYDGDGYLIADARTSGCTECLEPGVMEFVSVPVPGLCGVYYLLASKIGSVSSSGYHTQVSVLDMNADNSTYGTLLPNGSYDRKGRLLDMDTELATLHPQLASWIGSPDCLFENAGLVSSEWAPSSTHVAKLAVNPLGKSQSPMLRVVAGTTTTSPSWLFAIYTTRTLVYKITANGIFRTQAMSAGTGAPSDLYSVPTYFSTDPLTSKRYYRDADARFTSAGDIRLVQTAAYDYTVWGDPAQTKYNLLTMRFNATTGMLVPNSIQGYSLFEPAPIGCNPSLGNSGLAGCALRPGGGGVYVVGELTSDCAVSAPKFGYLDFTTGYTDLTASVPAVASYTLSRFYRNREPNGAGEAIYIPRVGGVDAITGISNPAGITQVSAALPSAVPPEHVDQPGQTSNNFQPRFMNPAVQGDLHLSVTAQASCCTFFQAVGAVAGYTHTGSASWTASTNPLGNTQEVIFSADVVIPVNTTLNVTGMIWRFAPNAKLIVQRGGRINFTNCKLTSLNCPNARWPGVRVEGTTNNGYQATGPAQGRMWLMSSTVIENAVLGTWCARELPSGNPDPAYYGGVVRSYGSTYRNCISGVRIENYHRYEGTGVEMSNLCSFSATSFRTTSTWPAGLPPSRHAQLANIKGVVFSACNFVNETPTSFTLTQRGRGIVARSAPFRCLGAMNANNRFENLEVGILASQFAPGKMYTVDGMLFTNDFKGVMDMGTTDAVIINNKFVMLAMPSPISTPSIGIYLYQSHLYTVERNEFTDQGTSVPSAGIWFAGPALDENQIYDNTFHDLNMACVVQGRHKEAGGTTKPGLQMLCGDHTNNLVDQFLYGDAYIRENQGGSSPQIYANNRYFSTPNCNTTYEPFVMFGHPYDMNIEYHHWDWNGDLGADPEMRPECVEDPNQVSITLTGDYYYLHRYNQQNAFVKEEDCGEGDIDNILGGGSQQISVLTGAYREKQAELRSAVATYKGTVDQGFTESLEAAIEYQPWHPSYYLRDYMLLKFPLSDAVLKAAIYRAEPMDPWHLTQVLIQNSPLSPNVYDYLKDTGVLPTYFHELLMQYKEGVSMLDVLEAEISGRQVEKTRLMHRLLWAMSEDSTTVNKQDTLLSVMLEDSTAMGPRGLYEYYLDAQDFAAAATWATTLALDPMTEPLVQFGTIYTNAQGDWKNATAADRSALLQMAYDHASHAGALAWSALLEIGELDSLPTPEVPETFKSLWLPRGARYQSGGNEEPSVAAYPNPAQDRVQITYGAGMEHGTLQLFDAQGRQMNDMPLNGQLAFKEVPLTGYAEGLYLARIVMDGFVLGETKFTVAK